MGREAEETIKKEDNLGKKKKGRISVFKSKGGPKKKARSDEMVSVNLEGEEEVPKKWRDYEIYTLTAICRDGRRIQNISKENKV
jgi:hypothetical protein